MIPRRPETPPFRIPLLVACCLLLAGTPGLAETRDAPFQLTASDGSGLALVRLEARGVLEGPLAFTELHLAFENPQARTIEGRFTLILPPGASISRFAMRVGEHWQEGEVVERQRARRVYEDILHRGQDPALLEHAAGNAFSARVFPIFAKETKELILSYSQELTRSDESYVILLNGLPRIAQLDVRVLVAKTAFRLSASGGTPTPSDGLRRVEHSLVEMHERDWLPDRDLVVERQGEHQPIGLRHDNLVLARLKPHLPSAPEALDSLYVLFDTSASRALGLERSRAALGRLVAGLETGARLAVAVFDQDASEIFSGRAGDFGEAQLRQLRSRAALGASDFEAALKVLAERLARGPRKGGPAYRRVLIWSDGVATAGAVAPQALAEAVRALEELGVERLDVVAGGGARDLDLLRRLSAAGLSRDGKVLPEEQPLAETLRRLRLATSPAMEVVVHGAEWAWPGELRGLQHGDEVLLYADLPASETLRVEAGGELYAFAAEQLAAIERPLLERSWVKARIDRLLDLRARAGADLDLAAALRLQVVELSLRHRVLSPFTALLVLESQADYDLYGIDRNALADILTVGLGGLELRRRTEGHPLPPPREDQAADLLGEIVDSTGEAVPGVEVTVDGPVQRATHTNSDGRYRFIKLPGGRYELRASLEGFNSQHRVLQVSGGRQELPPIELTLAEVSEQIVVTSEITAARAPAAAADGRDADQQSPGPPPSDDELEGLFLDSGTEELVPAEPTLVHAAAQSSGQQPPGDPFEEDAPSLEASSEIAAEPEPTPVLSTSPESRPRPRRPPVGDPVADVDAEASEGLIHEQGPAPYSGRFAEIKALLAAGRTEPAVGLARAWREQDPGDVLALLALGESLATTGELEDAARAYGSLIDLYPWRADLRRHAGQRLESLGTPEALALALDSYRKVVADRPDHPSSHRSYAYALLAAERFEEAFEALAAGLARRYPRDRLEAGIRQILREDLGLVVAAWIRDHGERRAEILERLRAAGGRVEDKPSLRFVLHWETDANDVDLHVYDGKGDHAYYSETELPSGGELYDDVTDGWGPECFTIRGTERAWPYRIQVDYYSRGPMGYGPGKVQIIDHDGRGGLAIEERPFVVMVDGAAVDLGTVEK